ncbi:hypothetical protein ACIQ1D_19480 [Lysinibacillus xylanilyticus]|uniref:hypothetical protein n=1 Tax=Lysinibacillus xylanilyticus TaxID=582475 RepID=UPI0038159E3B
MIHIRKIKTMYGLRYAVVDLFTHYTPKIDRMGNPIKVKGKVDYNKQETYHAVEYGKGKNTKLAIFPLTKQGLEQAKEVQKLFKKVGA